MDNKGKLVAVLACPPTTAGTRTRNRIGLIQNILGFNHCEITNLIGISAYRTGDISALAVDEKLWLRQRSAISKALSSADACLLGYGVSKPKGVARKYFDSQVEWLKTELRALDIPVYQVGGLPRHPSRWQRLTHKEDPARNFADALTSQIEVVAL